MAVRFFAAICLLAASTINAASEVSSRVAAMTDARMKAKMQDMSMDTAMHVLTKHNVTQAMTSFIEKSIHHNHKHQEHTVRRNFRGSKQVALQAADTHVSQHQARSTPEETGGYDGFGAAEEMISSLIQEGHQGLDLLKENCVAFFGDQTKALKDVRARILTANSEAARGRAEELDANYHIESLNHKIGVAQDELDSHNTLCRSNINAFKAQLDTIEQDMDVVSDILNLTTCNTNNDTALLQIQDIQKKCCKTNMSDAAALLVHHGDTKLTRLQSESAVRSMRQAFPLLEDKLTKRNLLMLQEDSVRKYYVKPSPDTPVLTPTMCPEAAHSKCTIADSPVCTVIQQQFQQMEIDIKNKRDDMETELAKTEEDCENERETLTDTLTEFGNELQGHEEALAQAISLKNTQDEELRKAEEEQVELERIYDEKLKGCTVEGTIECELIEDAGTCGTGIDQFETEICGLQKIRLELANVDGEDTLFMSDVVDCVVDEYWSWGPCDKTCGGGTLTKTREIAVHPSEHGAQCPPLTEVEPCNIHDCPIDCVLDAWGQWSECSASCDGGVRERTRAVVTHANLFGEACEARAESQKCNSHDCNVDCGLSEWSEWCDCSQVCNGGYQKRVKKVISEPVGAGRCWNEGHWKRTQYQRCNNVLCSDIFDFTSDDPYLTCKAPLDLILLIDGSGSLGQSGWDTTQAVASTILTHLDGSSGLHVGVMVYSGPKSVAPRWDYDAWVCAGWFPTPAGWDIQRDCKQTWLSHFTTDTAEIVEQLESLTWPEGGTFTNLAMGYAQGEISMGRPGVPATVVVMTDGYPSLPYSTWLSSLSLRSVATVKWILVGADAAEKENEVQWYYASPPGAGNVVVIENFEDWNTPDSINDIIANFCPVLDHVSTA